MHSAVELKLMTFPITVRNSLWLKMCIWLTEFIPVLSLSDRIWKSVVAQRPISAQRNVAVLQSKINPNRNKVQSQIKAADPRNGAQVQAVSRIRVKTNCVGKETTG